jgi:cytochrome c biogenesis protein CcmG/thiol:disulfide interchange protein DsbE
MFVAGFGVRRVGWVLGATLCALLAAGCDRGAHPARIGKPAPEFQVSDGSRSVDLAKLRGRVVLLNFWQSSCMPCVDELPSLERLQRAMPQVTVVGISNDEDPAAYAQFLKTYHVDFLTVRDPSFRVPTLYGTVKIPETYVIDRKGIVRRKFVSEQEWTSAEIMDYLNEL